MEVVHDSLPPETGFALTEALAKACLDPQGATSPYGVDSKTIRTVKAPGVFAVVWIAPVMKTVTVMEIKLRRSR